MDSRVIISKIKSRKGFIYKLECLFCSKKFNLHGYKFNSGAGKYCCLTCANSCPKRTKNLKTALSQIDNTGCKNPNYRGGHTIYQQYRKDFCEECGITREKLNKKRKERLEVHHIDKNRSNGAKENLQTLCVSCHRYKHQRTDYPEIKAELVKQFPDKNIKIKFSKKHYHKTRTDVQWVFGEKKPPKVFDFFVCACLNDNVQIEKILKIPAKVFGKGISIGIKSKYDIYRIL